MFNNILIVELKHLGTRVEQRKCEGSMCWNVTWSEGSLKNEKVQTKKTVRRVDKSRLYRRSKVNKEGLKFYRLKTKEVIRHWTLGIRTCLDRNDVEECFGETKTWSRGKTEQQQTSRTTAWYYLPTNTTEIERKPPAEGKQGWGEITLTIVRAKRLKISDWYQHEPSNGDT